MKRSETEQRERNVFRLLFTTFQISVYISTRLKVSNMKHLTKEQRYQIKAYLNCGKTKAFIAATLKVDKSTIYRELKRNSKKRGNYNPGFAQELSTERKERFASNRKFIPAIEKYVKKQIEQEQWSPEQIVGYCKTQNIPMVSHERIYAYIRENKKQGGNLFKHLRHRLKHRKRPVSGKQNTIKDRVFIDLRSDIINNKLRFGDW